MNKKKHLTQYLSDQNNKGDAFTNGQLLNKEVSSPSDTDTSLIYKDGK